MTTRPLPPAFAGLAPLVDEWALPSEEARYRKLHQVSIETLRKFYDAVYPKVDEIVAYLNQYPRGALPAEAQTLYDLAMTFTETSHPVDLRWDDVDFMDAYPWEKFEFVGVSQAHTE